MKKINLLVSVICTFIGLYASAQATLPVSRTAWSSEPTGWTNSGCTPRTSTFACSGSDARTFDTQGDATVCNFNATPNQLSFKLKVASMSGASEMVVEESANGSTYTVLGRYGTKSGATAITDCGTITLTLNSASRYVRWTYTKATGNCDIDDVSISAGVSNSITTSTITGSPFCAGASVSVPFTYTPGANFTSGSCIFTAQLSNSAGSFASAVNLQTVVSNTSGSQTISAAIPSNTAAGSGYRIRVVSNTPAVTGTDNGANLTVNELPAISSNPASPAVVCPSGGTASFTVLATGTGLTYQWQQSTDGGSTWPTTLSNTGVYSGTGTTTLTITNPPATMQGYRYRAVVSGTCSPAANSNGAAILNFANTSTSVSPAVPQSINPSVNGSTLTVTEGSTPLSRVWKYGTSPGSYTVSTGLTGTTYTPNFPASGTYYVVCQSTYGSPCNTTVTSNEVVVTVANLDLNTGTVTGTPFCAGASGITVPFTYAPTSDFPAGGTCVFTAQLSDASGNFNTPVNLQSVSSNASGSQSIAVTIPTGTPTGAGYRIRVVCNSPLINGTDNGSNIGVSSLPQGNLTANGPFCVTGAGTLTFTKTAGAGPYTVIYNDGMANRTVTNVISGTAFNVFTTPVTSTTTYTLVSVQDANCIRSSGFTGASSTITVNTLPSAPAGTDGSRCGTGTVNISATPNAGETVDWYAASSGGSVLSGGTGVTSFTTPSILTTTTYYAQSRNSTTACASPTRTAVVATVINAALSAPVANSNTTPQTINVNATDFTANWSSVSGATSYQLDVVTSFASLIEDFTDGDFTTNPAWSGDVSSYAILSTAPSIASSDGSFLGSNASVGATAVVTPSAEVNEWQFSLGSENFSGSSANYLGAILMSNVAVSGDIEAASFNGYYLKVGVDGGTDYFELWRSTGTTKTQIGNFSSGPNLASSALQNGYNLRITRNSSGVFQLYYSTGFLYSSAPTTSAGTLTSTTYTTSAYFGIYTNFANPGTTRRVYIDNIVLGSETLLSGYPVTTPSTTYSVTGLTAGSTYYYRVRAVNACGTSANSNIVALTTLQSVAPEINVKQSSTTYLTGSTYNFGNVGLGVNTDVVFTIENLGNTTLTVTTPLSTTGDYSIISQPTGTVAGPGTTSFTVRFTPTTTGTRTASVTITNNDSNEGSYVINFTGNGTGNNESIVVDNTNYASGTPEFNINPAYISYTDNTNTTTGKIIPMKLKIQDGGADLTDADNLGTILTDIKFTVKDHLGVNQLAQIKKAILTTSTGTFIAAATKVGTELVFSGMSGTNVTAADNNEQIIHLGVSFDETQVVDNTKLVFAVSSVTAGSSGSSFAAANGGGASTDNSNANDRNRVEVNADRLGFVQQPLDAAINTAMPSAVTIEAKDVNGRRDLDFTSQIRLTSTGTMTGSPLIAAASTGLATFSSIVHTTAGTYTLNAERSTTLDWDVSSSSFIITSFTYQAGDYRPKYDYDDFSYNNTAGTTNNWEYYNGTSWTTTPGDKAPQNASSTPGRIIINHIVYGAGSTTHKYNDIIIVDGGELILVDIDIPPVASEFINANKKIEVMKGGTLTIQGDIDLPSTAKLIVRDGGTLHMDYDNMDNVHPMWDGVELFEKGSTFYVTNWDFAASAQVASLVNISTTISDNADGWKFGNIIYDVNTGTNDWSIIGGPVDIINLAEGDFWLSNSSTTGYFNGATNRTGTNGFVVNGDMIVFDGNFGFGTSFTNDAFSHQFTINGDFIFNSAGHTLKMHRNGSSTAASFTDSVTVKGDFIITSSATGFSGDKATNNAVGVLNFKGDSTQLFNTGGVTVTGVPIIIKPGATVQLDGYDLNTNSLASVTADISVESNATLHFGWAADNTPLNIKKVTTGAAGTNSFTTKQGSTLKITSANGISKSTSTGNVQYTSSLKTFDQLATFCYVGKQNQITGDGLGNGSGTSSNGRQLIIDMAGNNLSTTLTESIGLTSATTLSATGGKLDIRSGQFLETTSAYITGSTGTLYMSPGTLYQIPRLSASSSDIIPRMDGTSTSNAYVLTGGTIELSGAGAQTLRGARSYYNLKFSGSNTLGANYKNLSSNATVNNNLDVSGAAIVDCIDASSNAVSFVGDGGLSMSGTSRLRIKNVTKKQPELTALNAGTNYSFTGGTVEFYGSSATQQQSIRGNYGDTTNPSRISYYAMEINAAAGNYSSVNSAGNANPSESFSVQNKIEVFAPAVLRLDKDDYVDGAGNFKVNSGAGLFYGSPQGIKNSGTGTADGNVRISGTVAGGQRQFSTGATYGFVGADNMVSGSGLPITVSALFVYKAATTAFVTMNSTTNVSDSVIFNQGIVKTNANELNVTSNKAASVKGHSASSYVSGNMRRSVTATGTPIYDFPVGTDSYYELASIKLNAATGMSNIRGFFTSGLPATMPNSTTCLINGTGIDNMLNGGYWTLTPDAYTSANYDITLNETGYTNTAGVSEIGIIKRHDESDIWRGTDNTGGYQGLQGAHTNVTQSISGGLAVAVRTGVQSFSDFGIGAGGTALPIELSSFDAIAVNNKLVKVFWETALEINNQRFEIERSIDAERFEVIGTINGAGNSTQAIQYQLNDDQPHTGVSYYRLKQIDFDGQYSYSQVEAVHIGNGGEGLSVYPMHTSAAIVVAGAAEGAPLMIRNVLGQAVLQLVATAGRQTVDVTTLSPGMYFINGVRFVKN